MRAFSRRSILAFAVAVALSLILFVYVSRSPYVFALGIILGAYLAQLSTFNDGVVLGIIASLPLGLYLTLSGWKLSDSNVLSITLNVFLLVAFGGVYCGVVTWLINSLKRGKVFFI
jgi:hypothetical protein